MELSNAFQNRLGHATILFHATGSLAPPSFKTRIAEQRIPDWIEPKKGGVIGVGL